MDFEKLFRVLSYATVFCGFLSLWVAGALGLAGSALFVSALAGAWFLEGRKWQISERLGTALIVLAVPLYYGLWHIGFFSYASSEAILPGVLAKLILTLSGIKLLQHKSDRDWMFLYIMAFFQVLLAAGMSISALYFGTFLAFFFCMVGTIIVFEMRKTRRAVAERVANGKKPEFAKTPVGSWLGRIPSTTVLLIFFIVVLAAPLFFMLPRVGGAGLGGDPGGVSTRSGFSDTVRLGGIGRIQQNDEVVMRVRLEGNDTAGGLKWRGMAHDTFDGQTWSRSRPTARETRGRGDRDIIQVDYATGRESLLLQTVYLEPLDTPVLFAAPRAVGVQGNFPILVKDIYGGISFSRSGERTSYKVLSDTSLPSERELRSDNDAYPVQFENYLQMPGTLDPRISGLAADVTRGYRTRLDAARAVENYLQTQFGYTLELKAGGADPLADFLFNVREGHCEYFATAMVIMLRSQGIAARLATGFQQGDYNETAEVFVVRQRHAHAWVEVYFPGEEVWVPFDPTPAAGQELSGTPAGIAGQFSKYLEALEMMWIQYFVAFDNQEQRSMFTSVKKSFTEIQGDAGSYAESLRILFAEWWKDVRGDNGFETRTAAVGYGVAAVSGAVAVILFIVLVGRKVRKMSIWSRIMNRFSPQPKTTIVEFYERMLKVLEEKGIVRQPHQTPMEFAHALAMPEVARITERYNSVRFGNKELNRAEREEIERWLGAFGSKG